MTKNEFSQAFKIADDDNIDLSNVDDSILFGCGLPDYKPVTCTLRQVAKLIRWQAHQLNGEWNAEALNEVREISRKNFLIAG